MVSEPVTRATWVMHPHYLVDGAGNRVSVQLPVGEWERLMDDLDDLYDVRANDAAKAEGGEGRPLEDLLAEIEQERMRATA